MADRGIVAAVGSMNMDLRWRARAHAARGRDRRR